jgi:hypothetical protein
VWAEPDLEFQFVQPRDAHVEGARVMALLAASISGLCVLAVLGLGYVAVTTDWSELECFWGTEPECREPDRGGAGLSSVRASSWILGAAAIMATLGAFVLALRHRRVAHAAPVLVLCTTSLVIAYALWSRL